MFVQTALVDFCSSMDRIVEPTSMFDEMLERDVFAWTMMMFSGLVQVGICVLQGDCLIRCVKGLWLLGIL